jgi:hypothetical protein
MSIHSLKLYPNIINIINSYLEPMRIDDNLNLCIKKDKDYINKLKYLTDNNIPFKYSIDYARYPEITMIFIINLAKHMSIENAYEILTNIPMENYKLYNIDVDNPSAEHIIVICNAIKLMHYNYSWSYILIKNNINIEMVKLLLNKYADFYFFELLLLNKTINDLNASLNIVIKSMNETIDYKNKYYKLRNFKISNFTAYNICKENNEYIDNIIEVANIGFNDVYNLHFAGNFNSNQIDFLQLSRLGYSTDEEFERNKQIIFNNAITDILINSEDFTLNNDELEPSAKKQKT